MQKIFFFFFYVVKGEMQISDPLSGLHSSILSDGKVVMQKDFHSAHNEASRTDPPEEHCSSKHTKTNLTKNCDEIRHSLNKHVGMRNPAFKTWFINGCGKKQQLQSNVSVVGKMLSF